MTQYVSKYPLPDPDSLYAKRIISLVKDIVFGNLESNNVLELEKNIDDTISQYFNF